MSKRRVYFDPDGDKPILETKGLNDPVLVTYGSLFDLFTRRDTAVGPDDPPYPVYTAGEFSELMNAWGFEERLVES